MLSGPLLKLALHVPPSCSSFPSGHEQSLLLQAGVSVIIANTLKPSAQSPLATASTCIPISLSSGATDRELTLDGISYVWLRGDRVALLDGAAALSSEAMNRRRPFIASLPRGGSASVGALKRCSTLAYQLHSTHRCSAIVLSWPELEAASAAAASGGWDGVTQQLTRMRNPFWTTIQGG